jgi:hypothetical protein
MRDKQFSSDIQKQTDFLKALGEAVSADASRIHLSLGERVLRLVQTATEPFRLATESQPDTEISVVSEPISHIRPLATKAGLIVRAADLRG